MAGINGRAFSAKRATALAVSAAGALSLALAVSCAVPVSAQARSGLVHRSDGTYYLKHGVEQYEKWATVKGKRYYFGIDGTAVKGPHKVAGKWYLFDSRGVQKRSTCTYKGVRFYFARSGRIDARSKGKRYWYADGKTRMTATDRADFKCLQYARKRLAKITRKSDGKAVKRKKAFKWVMRQSYVTHRRWDIRRGKRWTSLYAMDMLKGRGGDCQSTAASFAYLAAAIGYSGVEACVDNWKLYRDCHAWCMIRGRIFDPMFAEDSWHTYYNSRGGSYEVNPTRRFKVPQYSAKHAKKGKKARSKTRLVKGAKLVESKGTLIVRKHGKLVRGRWCLIGGKRSYAQSDGAAAIGPVKVGGRRYVFSASGRLLTGKRARVVKVGAKRYRVTAAGTAKPGWNKRGTFRYLKTGERATGVRVISSKLYAFSKSGVYDAKTTRSLRAAYGYRKDATRILELLGPGKLKTVTSCLKVNGISGLDATRKYEHFTLRTWIGDDGTELILGL